MAPAQPSLKRFLALGDSYTIGESVNVAERWPAQLVSALREDGVAIADPDIVATTGWTTADLAAGVERANPQGTYDLVSLLIGVNNQYRGRDPEEYQREFRALLARAIGFAGEHSSRVIVVSIPDWGVTPFAEGRDRKKIADAIDNFNAVNREETRAQGAHYVDITPLSRRAAAEHALTAKDRLHPSGAMYALWVKEILSVARLIVRMS